MIAALIVMFGQGRRPKRQGQLRGLAGPLETLPPAAHSAGAASPAMPRARSCWVTGVSQRAEPDLRAGPATPCHARLLRRTCTGQRQGGGPPRWTGRARLVGADGRCGPAERGGLDL